MKTIVDKGGVTLADGTLVKFDSHEDIYVEALNQCTDSFYCARAMDPASIPRWRGMLTQLLKLLDESPQMVKSSEGQAVVKDVRITLGQKGPGLFGRVSKAVADLASAVSKAVTIHGNRLLGFSKRSAQRGTSETAYREFPPATSTPPGKTTVGPHEMKCSTPAPTPAAAAASPVIPTQPQKTARQQQLSEELLKSIMDDKTNAALDIIEVCKSSQETKDVVNMANEQKQTPLLLAVILGREKVVQALLKAGGVVDQSVLEVRSMIKDKNILKALRQAATRPPAQTSESKTAPINAPTSVTMGATPPTIEDRIAAFKAMKQTEQNTYEFIETARDLYKTAEPNQIDAGFMQQFQIARDLQVTERRKLEKEDPSHAQNAKWKTLDDFFDQVEAL